MRPVVHVVGGGPGDPELLTVKVERLLLEEGVGVGTVGIFSE